MQIDTGNMLECWQMPQLGNHSTSEDTNFLTAHFLNLLLFKAF
jgi:hypothetical protein